ncbi:hypothetical protein [Altererythrobacter lauratis]|uniref:Uncharacterized protein n=1 Tax=Alteraurantiacibacter lauratis TaxID=2054627 RepID=A0ABV7EHG3_9SPHN
MDTLFLLTAAIGLAALLIVPHSKDRTKRMLQRGGAAAAFSIGIFGSVFSMMVA